MNPKSLIIAVALIALTSMSVHAGSSRAMFESHSFSESHFELTVAGGWTLYELGANGINQNAGSVFLFDHDRDNGLGIAAEAGWMLTENLTFSVGLWYMRGDRDGASSQETAPSDYQPAPSDEFVFGRDVTYDMTAPYLRLKYHVHSVERQRFFVSAGVLQGYSGAELEWRTEGLVSGDLKHSVKLRDNRAGAFGSIGLTRLLASSLSIGAELGYRYVPEMNLVRDEDYLVLAPEPWPGALIVPHRLDADFTGAFGMVTVTIRP